MLTTILALAGALLAAIAILALVFVFGMRRKSRWVHGPIIWASRRWLNPRELRTAGQRGAAAGIIRHVGRRTGRAYQTPVGVVPAADAILIALPYGRHVSWLKNVLAAGTATIVHEGRTYEVDHPELVAMSTVVARFEVSDRRAFRLLNVDECLRLRVAGE